MRLLFIEINADFGTFSHFGLWKKTFEGRTFVKDDTKVLDRPEVRPQNLLFDESSMFVTYHWNERRFWYFFVISDYGRSLFGSVWPSWMIQKCSTGPKLSRRTFWTGKKQDGKPEKSRFIEIYADFGSFRGLFGAVRRLWSIRGAIWPEGHSFITSIRLEPVSYEIVINISITPTLLTLYCE